MHIILSEHFCFLTMTLVDKSIEKLKWLKEIRYLRMDLSGTNSTTREPNTSTVVSIVETTVPVPVLLFWWDLVPTGRKNPIIAVLLGGTKAMSSEGHYMRRDP